MYKYYILILKHVIRWAETPYCPVYTRYGRLLKMAAYKIKTNLPAPPADFELWEVGLSCWWHTEEEPHTGRIPYKSRND